MKPTLRLPARLTPSRQSQLPGSRIGKIIDVGQRLPFSGALDEADLRDALHAIFAAEFVNPGHARRLETIQRILLGYRLSDHLKGEDVLQMVDRFRASLEQQFQPKQVLVEIPIATLNESGQRIEGFIDMLVETGDGWILIDHKSFPGKRSEWPAEAVSYSGQLALYREALKNLNCMSQACGYTSPWVVDWSRSCPMVNLTWMVNPHECQLRSSSLICSNLTMTARRFDCPVLLVPHKPSRQIASISNLAGHALNAHSGNRAPLRRRPRMPLPTCFVSLPVSERPFSAM